MSAVQVARIAERDCIGCTLCLDACLFDAIAGRTQHIHFVLPDLCPGCKLCLPVCPVDCITLADDPEHPERDRSYRVLVKDRARRHRTRVKEEQAQEQRQLEQARARFEDKSLAERQREISETISPSKDAS